MHDHSPSARLSTQEVEALIAAALPGARVKVTDMTGTRDHFDAQVIWDGFQGRSLVDQHRTVNTALANQLHGPTGQIHALKLTTLTPEQAAARGLS